ncbi:M phase phospho MPP10 [Babesia ovata]|uniref:M phase phospho MPP10 n=1 Tax=Babesia ovata TaxID=189622 RepID=A0A2H6KGS3_9APIC|nr:M phase phospho MPP10 [Babesia ovata]GBE62169.1 M phase phospho MPP10 [Babesia ovata]
MEKLGAAEDRPGSNGKSDEAVIPGEVLQKRPWKLLEGKGEFESLLRNHLLESLKGAIQLKRRTKYIKDEIAKKRSRRSAAVKRALTAARRDSNNIRESAASLGLEDLWTCLDHEIAAGIKPLKEKLETLLEVQPNRILKAPVNTLGQTATHISHDPGDERGSEQKTKRNSAKERSAGYFDYDDDNFEKQEEDEDGDDDEEDVDDDENEESDATEDIAGIGDHDDELEEDDSEVYGSDSENIGEKDQSKPKKKEARGVTKDRFFKMEEMEEFADGNFEDEADDFNYFESMGEESDTSKAAVEMMYGDFFDDPDASDEGSDTDDDNDALHCPRGLEGLDDDEKEMELLLQKVEDEEETDEEDENRDDNELMDFDFNKKTEKRVRFEEKSSEDEDEDDEISQLEKELVAQKHWSLMGETTGHKRPRNSLLDLDLELPQNSSFIHVENVAADGDDVQDEENMGLEEGQDVPIEIIIQQRIKAEVFDNVERKIPMEDQLEAIERLKQTRNKMNREEVEIDFNKSKMGLGDVYAKRYQEMFMATDQLDAHKQKLTEDFGKLMFKLDSLCNYSIVPKRVSEAEKDNKVASITVEAPINVVTASRPDDLADDTLEERKLTRNAKKRKFTNKLKALLKSGKATVEDVNKIKQKIVEKNRQKIQDAKSIKVTGQTKDQRTREKRSNRRVNIAELMSKRK